MGEDFDASCSKVDALPAYESGQAACLPGGRETLTIAEMARDLGITPRALRFYEGKGLLAPRREGQVRFYGRCERQRLALILKAKSLGFTLGEIHQMFVASPQPDEAAALNISRGQCFEQIRLLEQRKREIEAALAELRRTYSSFYARIANAAG